AADGMPRTARTLQERRDRTRRRELADEVDVADVDAELERRRGHERPQLAALQALLGREALLAREAAVVRGHGVLAEQLAQVPRRTFGHAPRIDEDERRAMLLDELGETRVYLRPGVARHHGFERRRRQLDRQIALAGIAEIDDFAIERLGRGLEARGAADQEFRH